MIMLLIYISKYQNIIKLIVLKINFSIQNKLLYLKMLPLLMYNSRVVTNTTHTVVSFSFEDIYTVYIHFSETNKNIQAAQNLPR